MDVDFVDALLVAWLAQKVVGESVRAFEVPPVGEAESVAALDALIVDGASWCHAGDASVDDGALHLPQVPAVPGIRRLDISYGDQYEVSIASGEDLRSTLALEGPDDEAYAQQLSSLVEAGGTVRVSYLDSLTVAGRTIPLDSEQLRRSLVDALGVRAGRSAQWDVVQPR